MVKTRMSQHWRIHKIFDNACIYMRVDWFCNFFYLRYVITCAIFMDKYFFLYTYTVLNQKHDNGTRGVSHLQKYYCVTFFYNGLYIHVITSDFSPFHAPRVTYCHTINIQTAKSYLCKCTSSLHLHTHSHKVRLSSVPCHPSPPKIVSILIPLHPPSPVDAHCHASNCLMHSHRGLFWANHEVREVQGKVKRIATECKIRKRWKMISTRKAFSSSWMAKMINHDNGQYTHSYKHLFLKVYGEVNKNNLL